MRKILVVDDNEANRELILEILEGTAKCDVAENGNQAFKAYMKVSGEDHPYDLILLDIAMPEINGIQLAKLIQEYERFLRVPPEKATPIIIITAYKERLTEAEAVGCKDFILKPVLPDTLRKKIEEVMDRNKIIS